MKQVLLKKGHVHLEEVPAPIVEPGTIVVQVDHSCISVGTELSGVKNSGMPLWKRAIKQPENAKKGLEMMAERGIKKTLEHISGKLQSGSAIGYSVAGTVIAVGPGVSRFEIGDRVACSGAQYANHAEIIRVPENLAVPVNDKLSLAEASTVTLGAIALQGVRRANPTLGETFVVVGLGILGQITAQLLKANGCRVIGIDLEKNRIDKAISLGMDMGLDPNDQTAVDQTFRLTDGYGADGVIVTAATRSSEVLSTAFKMCRKKGRVVLVGDVGLEMNRSDIYVKELDFLVSTSYGPGRYDQRYEDEGLEYPIGYVRWTENRNMNEYLKLIADGRIDVKSLVEATFPLIEADAAYQSLMSGESRPLLVLLKYESRPEAGTKRKVEISKTEVSTRDKINLAVIGAGSFAKGMHLPNISKMQDLFKIQAIASRGGLNASSTAKQFEAAYATTDINEVLADDSIDAVIIATRHNLHGPQTVEALKKNKHVFVEKPLALTESELSEIERFYADGSQKKPVLLTGFNRRFSPFLKRAAELIANRSSPMIIRYRMNAGYIPLDHWVHGSEGGGRNLGEACHIYDLFNFLTNSKHTDVSAQAVRPSTAHYSKSDNFVANVTYEDGSVASLTYTALGNKKYGKEYLEIFVDGKVIIVDDYLKLTAIGWKNSDIELKSVDKGQFNEMVEFGKAIKQGDQWPIPLWQQMQASRIALEVDRQIS